MATYIPSMRYWRVGCYRYRYGSFADNQFAWTHLRFLDSGGTPIGSPTVTEVGYAQLVDGTSAQSVADGDGGTHASISWGYYNGAAFRWGGTLFQYDFATPIQPAKFLAQAWYGLIQQPGGGQYYPYYPEEFEYWLFASSDASNWQQVIRLPNLTPTFDVSYTTDLDIERAFRYYNDTMIPYSGDGGIYGIVAEDGTPVQRPVYLFERELMRPIRRLNSTVDGAYAFENLNRDREYLVMAVDTTEEPGQPGVYKNALVRDRITPIPANGVPTDGLPFFFRMRSTMQPRPVCMWNYCGPETGYRHRYSSNTYDHTNYGKGFIDVAAGGGFDLRGIPLPIQSPAFRLAYPKQRRPDLERGVGTDNVALFSVEAVFEVPSGTDKTLEMSWTGPMNGYIINPGGAQHGLTVEVQNTGVMNVRCCLSGDVSLNAVRATTTLTPGTVVHVVICYSESQYIKIYVNGAHANTGSLSGYGIMYFGSHNGWTYASTMFPEGSSGNGTHYLRFGLGISTFRMLGTCGYGAVGSTGHDYFVLDSGIAYAALYDGDLSLTPDADGVPIAIRDMYSSYANGAVWTGGSRPGGWPTVPQFSGYGVEVAADAPAAWLRMQETSNTGPAVGYGIISTNGALRVWGERETDVWPAVYETGPGIHYNAGSLELWYRPVTLGTQDNSFLYTVNKGATVSSLMIYVNTSKFVVLRVYDTAGNYIYVIFSSLQLAVDTDYHIVVTWDSIVSTKARLYINGALQEEQNFFTQTHWRVDESGFTIGNNMNDPDIAPPYNVAVTANNAALGYMADVALYSYELPAARIAAHYAAKDS